MSAPVMSHTQTFTFCDPDVEGQEPALIGLAADGRAVVLEGPRALFEQVTGARLYEDGRLELRSANDGAWKPAPKSVRVMG